jgi:hypothetical protein
LLFASTAANEMTNDQLCTVRDFREHHRQEADCRRALLETATTPTVKARVKAEIEKHEKIAKGL